MKEPPRIADPAPVGRDEAMRYQIRIQGHLGRQWTDWFEGLAISPDAGGDTLLTGLVVDQAALHGLLRKVRDLGLQLISVVRLEPGGIKAEQPVEPDPHL